MSFTHKIINQEYFKGFANLTPKVSIVIPAYNCKLFILETVNSLLNQSFTDFELVILENGTTDGTREELKKIHDDRVRIIYSDVTISPPENWNKAVQAAKCDYVALFHGDDIYHRDIIQKQYEFLLENKDCGVVFTFAKLINHKGEDTEHRIRFPYEENTTILMDRHEFAEALIGKGRGKTLACPSGFFRKKVLLDVGLFETLDLKYAFDVDMWFKIVNSGYKIGYIPEEYLFYRVGKHQGTSTFYNKQRVLIDEFFVIFENRYLNEYMDRFPKELLKKYMKSKFKDYFRIVRNGLDTKEYDDIQVNILNMKELNKFLSFREKIKFFFKLMFIKMRLKKK